MTDRYIVIQEWMIAKLGLRGKNLLTYALIYGFFQDGKSAFSGSLSYIADWIGTDKRGAIRAINNLIEKGLIEKTKTEDKNAYKIRGCQNDTEGVSKCHLEGCQNDTAGGVKMTPHNNNINTNNNININISKRKEIYKEKKSDLGQALDAFKEMRKKIKKPLTDHAEELILKKLRSMTSDEAEQVAILEQSTMNSWQGIFHLQKSNGQRQDVIPVYDTSNNPAFDQQEYKEMMRRLNET